MPDDIVNSKQLLVEGKDGKAFFLSFLSSLDISDIQIQDFGGVHELPNFIGQLTKNSNFRKLVTSLGITRDAEKNSDSAFRSICTILTNVELPIPPRPLQPIGTKPRINVFIFPGDTLSGMLETLLLRAVADDPASKCIDEFITCVQKEKNYLPKP